MASKRRLNDIDAEAGSACMHCDQVFEKPYERVPEMESIGGGRAVLKCPNCGNLTVFQVARIDMAKPAPERHYESAQEEFQRRVRELYQLADKMGLRLTVTVRKKPASAPGATAQPAREPGEN